MKLLLEERHTRWCSFIHHIVMKEWYLPKSENIIITVLICQLIFLTPEYQREFMVGQYCQNVALGSPIPYILWLYRALLNNIFTTCKLVAVPSFYVDAS